MAIVHDMVVGQSAGHKVTANKVAPRHSRSRGQLTKKNKFIKVRRLFDFQIFLFLLLRIFS